MPLSGSRFFFRSVCNGRSADCRAQNQTLSAKTKGNGLCSSILGFEISDKEGLVKGQSMEQAMQQSVRPVVADNGDVACPRSSASQRGGKGGEPVPDREKAFAARDRLPLMILAQIECVAFLWQILQIAEVELHKTDIFRDRQTKHFSKRLRRLARTEQRARKDLSDREVRQLPRQRIGLRLARGIERQIPAADVI